MKLAKQIIPIWPDSVPYKVLGFKRAAIKKICSTIPALKKKQTLSKNSDFEAIKTKNTE